MNGMFGINKFVLQLAVSPLQGFCSNINSNPQGFVTLHPVLLRVGALPLKILIQHIKILFSQSGKILPSNFIGWISQFLI